jgi:hypothetical protein
VADQAVAAIPWLAKILGFARLRPNRWREICRIDASTRRINGKAFCCEAEGHTSSYCPTPREAPVTSAIGIELILIEENGAL